MKFMDAYTYLDRHCMEMFGDFRGMTAYIEQMQKIKDGHTVVSSWEEDLQRLNHCRQVRNLLVHGMGAQEELCTSEDIEWMTDFYECMLSRTDPISQYRKLKW